MTILTALFSSDMTTWDLADVIGGTVTTNTSTEWDITGGGAGDQFQFDGTGLTYGAGGPPSPLPNGGTFNTFSEIESGVLQLTITGTLGARKTGQYIEANDVLGLKKFWFGGNDTFNGSSQDDHFQGYDGSDTFNFGNGGVDIGEGLKGNDTFNMGAALTADDSIDGGNGADTMNLNGDYFVVFFATTLTDVETINCAAGHSYSLSLAPGNVGSGGLFVDASALGSGEFLSVDIYGNKAISAIGGRSGDVFSGGDAADTFSGRRGGDQFNGGLGGDTLTGGNDNDRFAYVTANQSTSVKFDTITDFDTTGADSDKILLTFAVSQVEGPLSGGQLDTATFDTDMEAAINAGVLGKHHAILWTPGSGDHAGDTFLIIEANNIKGYKADKDICILLGPDSDLGTGGSGLGTSDFGVIG